MVCVVLIMSMLILSGCASTGEQNASVAQTTPKGTVPEKKALPVERRGILNAMGFNLWENLLNVHAPGKSKEVIETPRAFLSLQGDLAVLDLEDRKLQFSLNMSNLTPTEDLSIVSIEFTGAQKTTLNFSNGQKEGFSEAYISVDPFQDCVRVREYKGSDTPLWEKVFRR